MTTKNYGFDEATVQITRDDGVNMAIFDVSPTTECRWVSISNTAWWLLTVFGSTREMLRFVAHEQINGATVSNPDRWLDEQVSMDGFDTWVEFVDNERFENEVT